MSNLISAGELRDLLCPIPDTIPDCATIPRSGIKLEVGEVTAEGDNLVVDFLYTFEEPFSWLEIPLTQVKGQQ